MDNTILEKKRIDKQTDSKRPDISVMQNLFKQLLYLRHAEETMVSLYKEQEMRTPTHFGTGQEAVAVGVCAALTKTDAVYSHHRCHNHYLAKGGDLFQLIAELYGREDGCSRGRGGSVHLTARDQGFVISSAILAQTIAVATGSALAFKMDNTKHISVCFFGEAICEEGAFYESINYASIHKLPVLFICENNLYSTESPLNVRQPKGTELCERVKSFKIKSEKIDGNDVFEVYNYAKNAVDEIRAGNGPLFLECMTYRWREHVGPNFDHDVSQRTYRTKAEFDYWQLRCPIKLAKHYLLENKIVKESDIATWQNEVESIVQSAVLRAKASKWPEPHTLFEDVL